MDRSLSSAPLIEKQPFAWGEEDEKREPVAVDQRFSILKGHFLARSYKAQYCVSCKWHSYSFVLAASMYGGLLVLDRDKNKKQRRDRSMWIKGRNQAFSVATDEERVLSASPPCNPCGRSLKNSRGLVIGNKGEELFFMCDNPDQLEVMVACFNFSDLSEPSCCVRMLKFLFSRLKDREDGRRAFFSILPTASDRQVVDYYKLLGAATVAAKHHTATKLMAISQVFGGVVFHIERITAFGSTLSNRPNTVAAVATKASNKSSITAAFLLPIQNTTNPFLAKLYLTFVGELLNQAETRPSLADAWAESGGLELFNLLHATEKGTNMVSTTVARSYPLLQFGGSATVRIDGFPDACQGNLNDVYELCTEDFGGRPSYVTIGIGVLLKSFNCCLGICSNASSSLFNWKTPVYLFWNSDRGRWQLSPEKDNEAEAYAYCPEDALLPDCLVSKWHYFHKTEEDSITVNKLRQSGGATCKPSSDLLYHHLFALYKHAKKACGIRGVADKVLDREGALVELVERFKLRGLGTNEQAERKLLQPGVELISAALNNGDEGKAANALLGPRKLGLELCTAFLTLTKEAGKELSLNHLPTAGIGRKPLVEIICSIIEGPIRIRHADSDPSQKARLTQDVRPRAIGELKKRLAEDVAPRLVDLAIALVEGKESEVHRFKNVKLIMERLRDLCELPAAADEVCRDPPKLRRLFRQLQRASKSIMDSLTTEAAITEKSRAQSDPEAWADELVDVFKVLCHHLTDTKAPRVSRAVFQCNLVPVLLKFIRYQAADKLLSSAAFTLNLLAKASLEHCETIEREGGIKDLLTLFRTGSPLAQRNSCFALTHILRSATIDEHGVASPARHVAFMKEGGAQTLVRFLRASTKDTDDQFVEGLQVLLQRLVAVPTMLQPLLSAGLLEYLKSVFEANANGPAFSRCLVILEDMTHVPDVSSAGLSSQDIRGKIEAAGIFDLLRDMRCSDFSEPKKRTIAKDGNEFFSTTGIPVDEGLGLDDHRKTFVEMFKLEARMDAEVEGKPVREKFKETQEETTEKAKLRKQQEARGEDSPYKEHDIMISYCHKQGALARALAKYLKEEWKFRVWIDTKEMRGNTSERMIEGVKGSKTILACVSMDYGESVACKRELKFAGRKKKRIIPLIAHPGFRLESHEGLDFFFLSGDTMYYKLAEVFNPEDKSSAAFTTAVDQFLHKEQLTAGKQPPKSGGPAPPSNHAGSAGSHGGDPPDDGFDNPAGEDVAGFGAEFPSTDGFA